MRFVPVGGDSRTPRPVESASDAFEEARRLGRSLTDDGLMSKKTDVVP
ncbi:hypothetical protein C474_03060 [Halogeometricum pallidum JCM 14848]|uniref:Uncharacterized protein n=1 Tax=Halogeometricum pallidum JCM 14848 TaxID=1227487 RepID=M0DEL2_HALPD|nr:hypothetical protein C474_03060 [Halogeometricum pallidum JCM 14848]